jgi:hypothetical protein
LPPSCRLKTLRLSLNLPLFQPFLRQYTLSSFLYTHVILMKHKSIVLAYLGGHKLWLRNARKNSCGCFEGSVCPSFHLDLQVESFDSFTRFILSSLTFFVTHPSSSTLLLPIIIAITMAKHHPDLVMCRKQPGVAIGRLCEKCECFSFQNFAFGRTTTSLRRPAEGHDCDSCARYFLCMF